MQMTCPAASVLAERASVTQYKCRDHSRPEDEDSAPTFASFVAGTHTHSLAPRSDQLLVQNIEKHGQVSSRALDLQIVVV
jgi:hypothetical protein